MWFQESENTLSHSIAIICTWQNKKRKKKPTTWKEGKKQNHDNDHHEHDMARSVGGFRVDIVHNRTHWKEARSWMGAYGACVKAQIQLSTNKLHFSSHHSQ